METNRLRNSTIILLAILLAVLYLTTVTVDPVFARNETGFKPKIYAKGDKIDKECKDKKNTQDDPIKIKSHPVLKSPPGSSGMSTMYYGS
ncbi:MAG TPA: hypothetical protein VF411_07745 [Bacteroidia bacterium]|jgi:hypothetical protein